MSEYERRRSEYERRDTPYDNKSGDMLLMKFYIAVMVGAFLGWLF